MTQAEALNILKTGANVFLTGEPGAGKTHTINEYVSYLREHDIEPSITASTGIASTHIGGLTIHSWSGIGIKSTLTKYDLDQIASREYVSKRVRRAKVLIIDEVSMLSPQMLDMVNEVCKEIKQSRESFGGMQVVFVGDFFQLPPIISKAPSSNSEGVDFDNYGIDLFEEENEEKKANFAYESKAWKEAKPLICYLTEQHRQEDKVFLDLLGAIRKNAWNDSHEKELQKRKISRDDISENLIRNATKLYSHNFDVDKINVSELQKIEGIEKIFNASSSGHEVLVSILKKGCLSPEKLFLKIGASVMFTKNNPSKGFMNGTIGEVVGFASFTNYPVVKIKGGRKIEVEPMDWSIEENGKIKAKITQFPLRLAWAITVHKSQGMSLDAAIMDLSQVFEYGQGYVALSRVRTFEGLNILGWNEKTFQVHPEVLQMDAVFREASFEAEEVFSKIEKDELLKLHENFIKAAGGSIFAIKNSSKKEKISTADVTLGLWNDGKNVEEIAKARNLKEGTIFDHIEDLVKTEKIKKEDLNRLISKKFEKEIPKIHKIFKEMGIEKLTPVMEKLQNKYSFEELRIARMLL